MPRLAHNNTKIVIVTSLAGDGSLVASYWLLSCQEADPMLNTALEPTWQTVVNCLHNRFGEHVDCLALSSYICPIYD